MAQGHLSKLMQHIRALADTGSADGRTDAQLLEKYACERDEAAFGILLRRHGPMVLSVCRRVLHNWHDAEDAYQATFLVLARKASSGGWRESVSNWLYSVAYRSALKAKTAVVRRDLQQKELANMPREDATATTAGPGQELRPLLDEELHRLPKKYRAPLVLCYLEGKSNEEAARQLGCPLGTVWYRLSRGRELLRARLSRRGLAFSTSAFVTVLAQSAAPAAVPTALFCSTLEAAALLAAQTAAGAGVSALTAALVEGVLHEMFLTKIKIAAVLLLSVAFAGGTTGVVVHRVLAGKPGAGPATAQGADPAKPPTKPPAKEANPAKPPAENPADKEVVVPIKEWSGKYSQLKRGRVAITNANQWEVAWVLAFSREGMGMPAPKTAYVDFDKHMVLAVSAGGINFPSAWTGYVLQITKIVRTGKDLKVYVLEKKLTQPPGVDAAAILTATQPWYFVLVPKSEGTITFVDDDGKKEAENKNDKDAKDPEDKEVVVPILKKWSGDKNSTGKPNVRVAITNAKQWEAWKRLLSDPKETDVDFDKHIILVVTMGGKATGGYSIWIPKIVRTGKDLKVFVREKSPGIREGVTDALTSPWHCVLVPKSEGKITFVDDDGKEAAENKNDKDAKDKKDQETVVPIVKEWHGNGGIGRRVITDAKQWRMVAKQAGFDIVPEVDFAKHMVLAVSGQGKPSSGHGITVTKIVRTEKGLQVYVLETSPPPGSINLTVMTLPCCLALVPKSEGTITFVDDDGKKEKGKDK